MYDLHMHSYYSDGEYSPEYVAAAAAKVGCKVVSLTDHDTLSGIAEMTAASEKLGMKNLSGIEISTYLECEAHILGYNIDIKNAKLNEYVAELEKSRRKRSLKILANLREHKIIIPEDYFVNKVKREISRSHIANAIVELGYEKDAVVAFNKWLREGAAAYEQMRGRSPVSAIEIIHEAGGKAVLAHPMRLSLDGYDRQKFIRFLKEKGLDGIEAMYKRASGSAVATFKKVAKDLDLFITAGGDYHCSRNEIIPRALPKKTKQALGIIDL